VPFASDLLLSDARLATPIRKTSYGVGCGACESVILLMAIGTPTLHVTTRPGDIPVEAHCAHCPAVSFKAQGTGHRPNRDKYQKSLQSQFDVHCRAVHSET
jgi:hypothetical protein